MCWEPTDDAGRCSCTYGSAFALQYDGSSIVLMSTRCRHVLQVKPTYPMSHQGGIWTRHTMNPSADSALSLTVNLPLDYAHFNRVSSERGLYRSHLICRSQLLYRPSLRAVYCRALMQALNFRTTQPRSGPELRQCKAHFHLRSTQLRPVMAGTTRPVDACNCSNYDCLRF